MLNGGPVTWASKLQKSCAQSTAEAEVIAATEAVKESLHLQLMLKELHIVDESKGITILEDNPACIAHTHRSCATGARPSITKCVYVSSKIT